ncbi:MULTISPECIES: hypothetical protein [Bacillus cereus group]|uniref:hypothetical protein n=1 Tax=Bacillus cereus group TaxID=86661 RepID=UPI000BFE63EB|nr:hypothetical protein [Bacillus thuringiensis]NKX13221.1 hypothetical protein [Bacillus cereus]PGU19096.1 hypothetical protein COD23_08705 [Bacillus thuringiensis]
MLKNKIKKVLGTTLLAGAIVAVGSGAITHADTKDTHWNFAFDAGWDGKGNHSDYTGYRTKYNDSSVYKKIQWTNNGGESYSAWIEMGHNGEIVSKARRYTSDAYGVYKIPNNAYELYGKRDVTIRATLGGNFTSCRVEGVWSPDSR